MTNALLVSVLRPIRHLTESQATRDQSDDDLLILYCANHDENAFELMVRRYGRMVMGRDRHAKSDLQASLSSRGRNSSSFRASEDPCSQAFQAA
jgi:hypothetical protein